MIETQEKPKEVEDCAAAFCPAERSGRRCGLCYWALYDGDWCQNNGCDWRGESIPKKNVIIGLTNTEAMTLIKFKQKVQAQRSAGATEFNINQNVK